jgi:hypothetical protein
MHHAAAILYAWATSVLLAIALGFLHGSLTHGSAVVALAGGAAFGVVGWLHARQYRTPSVRPHGWEWFPIVLFALFSLRAFLWLIFEDGDELRVLSPNNLGDMSLHLTFIHYFANGAPFWPDSPIFAQGKLTYSVGTDLFNSLLVLVGVDVVRGLVWVGLIGAALTGIALWKWGRAFALLGFLCSGGLLGFACFAQPTEQPFLQDYAGLLKFDWAWKSLPLALLVTQRGFLFALPAGLLLLTSWRSRFLKGGDGWRMPLWGELLLYAAMPVFHMHTFIALSFLLACWFLSQSTVRTKIAALVASAFVPASALVYLTIGMLQSNAPPSAIASPDAGIERPVVQILGWQPGWMVNEPLEKFDPWALLIGGMPAAEPLAGHGRFLLFWLGNFGLLPFFAAAVAWILLRRILGARLPHAWMIVASLVFVIITPFFGRAPLIQADAVPLLAATVGLIAVLVILARRGNPELWPAALVFPGLYLFFLCCNVKFAPAAWDNTKLMVWAYLLVLPFLWDLLIVRWRWWQRGVALVLLFFSGFVGLLGGLNSQYQGYPIARISELDAVREATRHIPITETFAAEPTYNHPLLLTGHKLALGYSAHVWSHGIFYQAQEIQLDALMQGGGDWRTQATRLQTRYLFFGPRESAVWPESAQRWRDRSQKVASGEWGDLFDLKMPPVRELR